MQHLTRLCTLRICACVSAGVLLVVAAFVSFSGTFEGIIIPIYNVLFGALVCIMVFYIPPSLAVMIPFYVCCPPPTHTYTYTYTWPWLR